MALPCARRRVPVVQQTVVLRTPLANALEAIVDKNNTLFTCVLRCEEAALALHRAKCAARTLREGKARDKKGESEARVKRAEDLLQSSLQPLSQQLTGVIDAAVQGGVAKYVEAFFESCYMEENPHEQRAMKRFKRALSTQLEVLDRGLRIFHAHSAEKLKPLVDHLKKMFNKMSKLFSLKILKRSSKLSKLL